MSEQTIKESTGFFPDPCNGPEDLVRQLTDTELRDIGREVFALARQYGGVGGGSGGTTAGQYLEYLGLHLAGESMRRERVVFLHHVELFGGHSASAIYGPRSHDGWGAQCFCGWEGPDRDTEAAAETDAEAHMAPHTPAWLQEDAS